MKLVEAATYIYDLLKTTYAADTSIAVYYGDQSYLDKSIAFCVEPDIKSNEYVSAFRKTKNEIRVMVLAYSMLSDDQNRIRADTLAEDMADIVQNTTNWHADFIDCHAERIESGYAPKANTMMRATRVVFKITTQEMLPTS